MSLVIAASPGRSPGSADAPTGSSARKLTSGTASCSTVQTRRPLLSVRRRISGNRRRRIGAERRTAITIDAHHAHRDGFRTGKRQLCPSSRDHAEKHTPRPMEPFAGHTLHRCGCDAPIAIEITVERILDRQQTYCRRSADRTCRRTRRRSATDTRNSLRLAPGNVPSRAARALPRPARRCACPIARSSSASVRPGAAVATI